MSFNCGDSWLHEVLLSYMTYLWKAMESRSNFRLDFLRRCVTAQPLGGPRQAGNVRNILKGPGDLIDVGWCRTFLSITPCDHHLHPARLVKSFTNKKWQMCGNKTNIAWGDEATLKYATLQHASVQYAKAHRTLSLPTHHNTSRFYSARVARVMFVASLSLHGWCKPQVWSKGLNFEWLGGLKTCFQSFGRISRWSFLPDHFTSCAPWKYGILDTHHNKFQTTVTYQTSPIRAKACTFLRHLFLRGPRVPRKKWIQISELDVLVVISGIVQGTLMFQLVKRKPSSKGSRKALFDILWSCCLSLLPWGR